MDVREERRTDVVGREAGGDRIEAERGEDHEAGQAAAVLVARDAHHVVAKPCVEALADAFLRLPGCSGIVIYIRYMQRRLVGHRELADVARLVGHLAVESGEVASVLAQADGALEGAVVGGVEDSLLVVGAALDKDVAQGLVPFLAAVPHNLGDVERLALLTDEVLPGLFGADEGDAVAELNLLCAGREEDPL